MRTVKTLLVVFVLVILATNIVTAEIVTKNPTKKVTKLGYDAQSSNTIDTRLPTKVPAKTIAEPRANAIINQSNSLAPAIRNNTTNQTFNMSKGANGSMEVQLLEGDARNLQIKPEIIAFANTTYSHPPKGVTITNSSGPIWSSPDGQLIALLEKDQWIEATYSDKNINMMGIQFYGDSNDGWAKVLVDGAQVWSGNTYNLYKYLQISDLTLGHHTIRLESMGIKGSNKAGNGTNVQVAYFGFGKE